MRRSRRSKRRRSMCRRRSKRPQMKKVGDTTFVKIGDKWYSKGFVERVSGVRF